MRARQIPTFASSPRTTSPIPLKHLLNVESVLFLKRPPIPTRGSALLAGAHEWLVELPPSRRARRCGMASVLGHATVSRGASTHGLCSIR